MEGILGTRVDRNSERMTVTGMAVQVACTEPQPKTKRGSVIEREAYLQTLFLYLSWQFHSLRGRSTTLKAIFIVVGLTSGELQVYYEPHKQLLEKITGPPSKSHNGPTWQQRNIVVVTVATALESKAAMKKMGNDSNMSQLTNNPSKRWTTRRECMQQIQQVSVSLRSQF